MSIQTLDTMKIYQIDACLKNLEDRLEIVSEKFESSIITSEEYNNITKDIIMQQNTYLKAKIKKMNEREKIVVETMLKIYDESGSDIDTIESDSNWEGYYKSEEATYNL